MIFEKIRTIIAGQMSIAEDKVTMNTSFADDLGADSLDIFQIISELEEEFNMEFSNDAAEKVRTVADAVEYIKNYAGE
ncbi:MAG: acyl carrier protein [Defluviitaleaceae bacterium]|nr:acyl carrier protein [Defluviitaleaceae bacterium]